MEYEVSIPEPLAGLLLIQAALREVSAEEIVTEAIQNFLERNENIG